MKAAGHREFLAGLIRLHILHHAVEGEFYGNWMIEELRDHGYRIGPGTLYPMLHALEAGGLVVSRHTIVGGKTRRYYRTTRAGDALLRRLRPRIRELVDEVLQESGPKRER